MLLYSLIGNRDQDGDTQRRSEQPSHDGPGSRLSLPPTTASFMPQAAAHQGRQHTLQLREVQPRLEEDDR